MRSLRRPPEPAFLVEHAPRWTELFVARRRTNPAARFQWHHHEGRSVYELMVEALGPMSHEHCAYCDAFPLDAGSKEEIDHFEPKSAAPERAYHWPNLYLSCPQCNGYKHDRYDPLALRPDEAGYAFDRFFVFDHADGRLSPHPRASADACTRAEATLALFGLNEDGRPAARKRTVRQFRKTLPDGRQPITDFPFVYLLLHESI